MPFIEKLPVSGAQAAEALQLDRQELAPTKKIFLAHAMKNCPRTCHEICPRTCHESSIELPRKQSNPEEN